MFPVIPKWCCHFLVVQSFQFEITTHLTYLQGKHSWWIDRKYNYCKCWCYIIHIKWCFLHTNQWLLLHVFVICLQAVTKITQYMDACFWRSFFSAFFSVWWLYLEINHSLVAEIICTIYIHLFMHVHNTTFQIKTVFNNVLFSTEVHNPLHAHLLALSHICITLYKMGRKKAAGPMSVPICSIYNCRSVTITTKT